MIVAVCLEDMAAAEGGKGGRGREGEKEVRRGREGSGGLFENVVIPRDHNTGFAQLVNHHQRIGCSILYTTNH